MLSFTYNDFPSYYVWICYSEINTIIINLNSCWPVILSIWIEITMGRILGHKINRRGIEGDGNRAAAHSR